MATITPRRSLAGISRLPRSRHFRLCCWCVCCWAGFRWPACGVADILMQWWLLDIRWTLVDILSSGDPPSQTLFFSTATLLSTSSWITQYYFTHTPFTFVCVAHFYFHFFFILFYLHSSSCFVSLSVPFVWTAFSWQPLNNYQSNRTRTVRALIVNWLIPISVQLLWLIFSFTFIFHSSAWALSFSVSVASSLSHRKQVRPGKKVVTRTPPSALICVRVVRFAALVCVLPTTFGKKALFDGISLWTCTFWRIILNKKIAKRIFFHFDRFYCRLTTKLRSHTDFETAIDARDNRSIQKQKHNATKTTGGVRDVRHRRFLGHR